MSSHLAVLASKRPEPPSRGMPRLVFFRPDRADLPDFILRHLDEHVRCLQMSFDVTVISEDCDYDAVCDRVRPDVALFESGTYVRRDRRISNTQSHPEIPKLGLLDSDAYCVTRSVFLSDMDRWGVDTFFTISMAMASHFPEMADRLFVWPNFADKNLYRTYPGGKASTILLTGSRQAHYPWRARVHYLLEQRYPVRSLPHSGWFDREATRDMVSGEPYARLLSGSQIVPACGTIANELVRKHLEIPAAGACLLTERSSAVESAGFVDMESCVFADETDVIDKVEHLLAHPDELARISRAGQELVHARHDMANRDQIRQWYELHRMASSGDVIAQPEPFGKLVARAVGRPGGAGGTAAYSSGDRILLASAADAEFAGVLGLAKERYRSALTFHFMPEAAFGLARSSLRSGDAQAAREWVWASIKRSVLAYRTADPDPMEWALYVRSLLCQGKTSSALRKSREFPWLHHLELDRIRIAVAWMSSSAPEDTPRPGGPYRPSIHVQRAQSWVEWSQELVDMLAACGQHSLSRLAAGIPEWTAELASGDVVKASGPSREERSRRGDHERLPRELRRSPWRWAKAGAGRVRRRFAPRNGAVGDPILDLLVGRDVRTVVLTGVALDDPVVGVLEEFARRDPGDPALIFLGVPRTRNNSAEWLLAHGTGSGRGRGRLADLLVGGGMLVAGPEAGETIVPEEIRGASLVALSRAIDPRHGRLLAALAEDPRWRLVHDGRTSVQGADLSTGTSGGVVMWQRLDP